jgi:hypothetical protein
LEHLIKTILMRDGVLNGGMAGLGDENDAMEESRQRLTKFECLSRH